MLTVERLREVLNYDPTTGLLAWRTRISIRVMPGKIAGHQNRYGYISLRIDGILYQAHVLAWFYMTGEWIPGGIDHRDLDGANNKWINLRRANRSQQEGNTRINKRNMVGLKGVGRNGKIGKYRARCKNIMLGWFDCPAAAHLAYIIAADKEFGEFARSR
jgi:hypothetical protein